jgi:hypothetical protein
VFYLGLVTASQDIVFHSIFFSLRIFCICVVVNLPLYLSTITRRPSVSLLVISSNDCSNDRVLPISVQVGNVYSIQVCMLELTSVYYVGPPCAIYVRESKAGRGKL